jgi:hypothetical protein
MRIKYIIFALAGILSCVSDMHAGLLGPSNYDECVLENMKGVTSDVAARAVIQSCKNRFPNTPKATYPSRSLSSDELSNLHGTAGPSSGLGGGNYRVSIYNGNEAITIIRLEIWITTRINGFQITRRYAKDVKMLPLSTSSAFFDVTLGDEGSVYSWGIANAQGY